LIGAATAAGAALVSPASVLELEGLLARARAASSPPLTVATLNALLRTASTQRDHALLNGARRDLKAFVRSHFTLTAKQDNDLASLSPRDVNALHAAIDAAIRDSRVMDATCDPVDMSRSDPIAQSEHFGVASSRAAGGAAAGPITVQMTGF
jgi:hypothetical protein